MLMAFLVLLSAEGLSQRAADSTELDTFLCNYLTLARGRDDFEDTKNPFRSINAPLTSQPDHTHDSDQHVLKPKLTKSKDTRSVTMFQNKYI